MTFTREQLGRLPSPFYRVTAKALIFDEHDRLLVLRNEKAGYEIPGGGWEFGESYDECLRREVYEELGVGIDKIDSKYQMWVGTHHRWGFKMLRIATRVTLLSHECAANNQDVTAIEWIDKAKFMTIDWKYEGETDDMARIIWIENKRSNDGE